MLLKSHRGSHYTTWKHQNLKKSHGRPIFTGFQTCLKILQPKTNSFTPNKPGPKNNSNVGWCVRSAYESEIFEIHVFSKRMNAMMSDKSKSSKTGHSKSQQCVRAVTYLCCFRLIRPQHPSRWMHGMRQGCSESTWRLQNRASETSCSMNSWCTMCIHCTPFEGKMLHEIKKLTYSTELYVTFADTRLAQAEHNVIDW